MFFLNIDKTMNDIKTNVPMTCTHNVHSIELNLLSMKASHMS
jgi:hypothetical protein